MFKVFGDKPDRVLKLAWDGLSRQDILQHSGQSIGVLGADFSVIDRR